MDASGIPAVSAGVSASYRSFSLRSENRESMNVAHRTYFSSMWLIFPLLLMMFLGACEIYDGDLPSRDELHMPNALAVHPSGDYLYVFNSNFDARYRQDLGGSISVVDLDALSILSDSTLCVPSFGSSLTFSAPHTAGESPRYLLGATKSNRGAIALSLSDDGSELACTYKGEDIGNTCVNDIAKLTGVSKKRRYLPCEVRDVMDDPSSSIAIPPHEQVTPEDQDAFMLIGQRDGSVIGLNFVHGEMRGQSGQEGKNQRLHLSPIFRQFVGGATSAARHPLTDDIYIGGRNDRTIRAVQWLREPTGDPTVDEKQGFAVRPAISGRVQLHANTSNLELRAMEFSEDGSRLYAIARQPGSLFVVDTALDDEGKPRNRQMHRIVLSGQPGDLALTKQGGRTYAYVSLFNQRKIAVVDVDSGTRVASVDVGSTPYALVADPIRPRIYVALFEENAVAVIDADPTRTTWNRQIATIR